MGRATLKNRYTLRKIDLMDTGNQKLPDILELITKSGAIQGQGTPVSLLDLIVALIVASLIGIFAAWIYQRTHRGMTYERTFIISMIMIGPIISWIIMLIGSNLALSLGMVGALSIIRFRNVIKDSRDMIYLFWGIAVGLGSGTYNWSIVITASICIGCVMMLLDYLKYGIAQSQDCIFVLRQVYFTSQTFVHDF